MKDKECWKECEYANPKSEIISAYLMKKQENEELKTQIQKMKCCGNCKHSSYSALFHEVVCIKALCRDFDKWELEE